MCIRDSCIPVGPLDQLGPIGIGLVVWRHDLHAVLVEDVEDVALQLRMQARYGVRVAAMGIDFVADAEIAQFAIEHERRRFGEQARGARHSHQQQRLDLTPGRLVADADRAMHDLSLIHI